MAWFTSSPAGWLPVHRDQLRAQRSVTSMGKLLLLPRWAGTRKVKPIWILLKQETASGSGISWAICKSAPCSRQITMPKPRHLVFYSPDALAAAQPTVSKHWRLQTAGTFLEILENVDKWGQMNGQWASQNLETCGKGSAHDMSVNASLKIMCFELCNSY